MARIALAAALVFLAGCSAPDAAWRADDRFNIAQRAEIEEANQWLADTMGIEPIVIEWVSLEGEGARTILISALPGNTGGDSGRSDIRIDVTKSSDRIGPMFAHELAHVRGLLHHDGPGLMSISVPPSLEWSVGDEAACVSAHACVR